LIIEFAARGVETDWRIGI